MNQITLHSGFLSLLQKVGTSGVTDVIFDLDGTLVDSAPGIVKTIAHILDSYRITPARPVDRSIVGPPLEEMLGLILAEEDFHYLDSLIDSFKVYYDIEGYKASAPFDGVDQIMHSLVDMGVTLHIATNKRYRPTANILGYLGWTECFASVYSVDSGIDRFKNKADMLAAIMQDLHLLKNFVLYVGDTRADEAAAATNHIAFQYASWGYEPL